MQPEGRVLIVQPPAGIWARASAKCPAGLVDLTLMEQGHAKIVVRARVVRVQGEGLEQVGHAFLGPGP